jgi:RNase P/RNase MRP subunit POP5
MPVRGVRRRYLYIKVNAGEIINEDHFFSALSNKVHFLYGVTGSNSMNMKLIEWDNEKQAAIIRINHIKLNEARTVIAHIQKIKNTVVRLDVVRVSGTIKTLKSKL